VIFINRISIDVRGWTREMFELSGIAGDFVVGITLHDRSIRSKPHRNNPEEEKA
jgi:hypothetical protein